MQLNCARQRKSSNWIAQFCRKSYGFDSGRHGDNLHDKYGAIDGNRSCEPCLRTAMKGRMV